ncbi:IS3 family transposase [Exiguobacterium mexicanum]
MESFFGNLKNNVDYYNCERKQRNLKKITPEQYQGHLIAA